MVYRIAYTLAPAPSAGTIAVTMQLSQHRDLLRGLAFDVDDRILDLSGDGSLTRDGDRVSWEPPSEGGRLNWTVHIAHMRGNSGYDAWMGPDWGLFRAEDVIPRASSRSLRGARSDTSLSFDLPTGWSAVTPYHEQDDRFHIDNNDRRFDQPGGWMLLGKLGVRRETIAGVRVAVAAPVGQDVRRMDMIALLNWTLPELARVTEKLPPRLTIVSAGEPMWRGGLSGPRSLYLHADRPLISENSTSTLLHEVLHTTLGISGEPGYDWIVEGFAEFYSLELLRRSGTISQARHRRAAADLATWSRDAKSLCGNTSSGARTAYAVTLLYQLDERIRETSDGQASLDDVLDELNRLGGSIGLDTLASIASRVAGAELDLLSAENLPGCGDATETPPAS